MTRLLLAAGLAAALSSAAAAQSIPVTLSEWKIEMGRDTVKAGSVTFRVKNAGTIVHGLHIDGQNMNKETPQIPANQSASLTVTLKPGTYDMYCPMSDETHKKSGMAHKLVVIPADAPTKKP
jgi:uncharacterized cupredoxin-like copper-binding protein